MRVVPILVLAAASILAPAVAQTPPPDPETLSTEELVTTFEADCATATGTWWDRGGSFVGFNCGLIFKRMVEKLAGQGNLAAAEALVAAAERINAARAREAREPGDEAMVLLGRAKIAESRLKFVETEELLRSAFTLFGSGSAVDWPQREVAVQLGSLMASQGRFGESLLYLETAWKAVPVPPPADHSDQALANLIAQVALAAGKIDTAKRYVAITFEIDDAVRAINPDFPVDNLLIAPSLRVRAKIAMAERRYADALADMERSARIFRKWPAIMRADNNYPTLLRDMAQLNVRTGNIPRAVELLREVRILQSGLYADTHPENFTIDFLIARFLLAAQGDLGESRAYLLRATSNAIAFTEGQPVGTVEDQTIPKGIGTMCRQLVTLDWALANPR